MVLHPDKSRSLIIFTIHYILDALHKFRSRLCTLKVTAQIHEACGSLENTNTLLRKN
jgi:hypothetical protein